jgi:hypothetical protein
VWNLGEDTSYMIGLHAADRSLPRGDLITDFVYNSVKATLFASTVSGKVVMWRLVGTQVRGRGSIHINQSRTSAFGSPFFSLFRAVP